MNFSRYFTNTIKMDLESSTKEDVLTELVDIMVDAGQIPNRTAAIKAVKNRELKMSTGMQNGIAIPHGKTSTVKQLVAALGIKRSGINFDALDGRPTRIFIMTISPADKPSAHIKFLASVSRLLSKEDIRNRLLKASSTEELLETLSI
ncbi:MAG: PTS sugar transporter subunit IIA [Lentisphaerae bacterium]|nr:PTS sugar transporter subunit IIA [Lentisphaerota bacterium]